MDRGNDDRCGPEATFTIHSGHGLRQRISSFAAIPVHLYTPARNPFCHIRPLVPNSAACFLHQRVAALLTGLPYSDIFKSIYVFDAGRSNFGSQDIWKSLKAALLADGYRTALIRAIVAILINHIRRTLVPWLGAFMFCDPVDNLRLALSNPDVYLEQTLSYSWAWAFFSHLQTYTLGVLAILTAQVLLVNNGCLSPATVERLRGSPRAVIVSLEGLMHLCKIGIGVYMLMTLDYIFSRAIHTISCLIAFYKLLGGNEAEHLALSQTLTTHWTKVPLIALMLWHYMRHALWPTFSGAIRFALLGRPGLLITLVSVAGGVAATIKWRARLYILLEMSPMFIVFGWVVVAVLLVARESMDDPSGLRASTAGMGRRSKEAREALQLGRSKGFKSGGDTR